jgi:hypothetical protein
MLHVLHLDVSKIDHVLHMGFSWKAGGVRGVSAHSLVARATSGQRGPYVGVRAEACWRERGVEFKGLDG